MEKDEFNKLQRIFQLIDERTTKDSENDTVTVTTELDPINVCLVGPKASGKTSLIASLFAKIEELNSAQYELEVGDETKDEVRELQNKLQIIKDEDVNEDVSKLMQQQDDVATFEGIAGSDNWTEYKFKLHFKKTRKDEKKIQKVTIPFVFMDVQGGMISGDIPEVDEFVEHRKKSSIIIVPFDSMLLMQTPINNYDDVAWKSYRSGHLGVNHVERQLKKWIDNRIDQKDPHSIAMFVAMKSETYHSYGGIKAESINAKPIEVVQGYPFYKCFNIFKSKYQDAIDIIKNRATEIVYTPLETIGCISCDSTIYDEKSGLVSKFLKRERAYKLLGSGVIFDKIINRAFEQLEEQFGNSNKYIELIQNTSAFDSPGSFWETLWAKFKMFFNNKKEFIVDFYNTLNLIENDLKRIAATDKAGILFSKTL